VNLINEIKPLGFYSLQELRKFIELKRRRVFGFKNQDLKPSPCQKNEGEGLSKIKKHDRMFIRFDKTLFILVFLVF
jgi:hypothetical protein